MRVFMISCQQTLLRKCSPEVSFKMHISRAGKLYLYSKSLQRLGPARSSRFVWRRGSETTGGRNRGTEGQWNSGKFEIFSISCNFQSAYSPLQWVMKIIFFKRPSLIFNLFYRFDSTETRSLVHLVDLAGSEAVGKAGNQGSLKLEGISINQGLLALSNCIRAVIQKSQHIPVRNTALTIVLQGLF